MTKFHLVRAGKPMNTTKVIFQKHSFRQTQQGVVVSYLVDPVDMPDKLATDPLGTMYGAVLVEVDENDEAVEDKAEDKKPKRSFHDMPRSQQAGMLCADPKFIEWFGGSPEDTAAGVRGYCGVVSRSEIDDNHYASTSWDELVGRYRQETGQEPEIRG